MRALMSLKSDTLQIVSSFILEKDTKSGVGGYALKPEDELYRVLQLVHVNPVVIKDRLYS